MATPKSYWLSLSKQARDELASRVGCSTEVLRHYLANGRPPSWRRAKIIESETAGLITAKTLRPDIYGSA